MAHLRETRPDRGRRKGEQGFTLIELLVVITIISILAAVVSTSVGGFITQANEQTRRAQFAAFQTAVDTFVSSHLDASGDLTQATYPIAEGTTKNASAASPITLITTDLTGEVSQAGWYGRDGRLCAQSDAACTAKPVAAAFYLYVNFYGATATNISSFLSTSGGVKSFAVPGASTKGVRCLFVTGSAGSQTADAGVTDTTVLATDIATAKVNVRANKGKIYVCRDSDPLTAGA